VPENRIDHTSLTIGAILLSCGYSYKTVANR
jgi:hypothetical protein